ncbi:MAG TPA: hypothetical protein VKM55_00955 [Candidatus Lokiarchaeia archaeon]|nr:hypothetical protein [Candidatus Lokiarchaeia archaeon]
MAKKKQILIEYDDEEAGHRIFISKDAEGKRDLETDFMGGIKSKLEDMIEDGVLKNSLKWALKYVPRDYHLENMKVSIVDEGLRLEEENGDFHFVDLPPEEAQKFLDVIEQSTELLPSE